MKLLKPSVLILGAVLFLSCANCRGEQMTADQLRIDAGSPEYKGMMPTAPAGEWKMREVEIESKALKGKGKFSIYLPPGYEGSKKSYPVVYYLHGMGDNYKTWLGGEQEMDRIAAVMTEKGDIIPMILVAPEGGKGFWSDLYDGSVGYESWVVKEIKSYVEKNYRVLKGKKNTVLAGVSMGGYGALKIAMRHMDMFSFVCAISPAILPPQLPADDKSLITQIFGPQSDPDYYRQNHPYWIAMDKPKKTQKMKFVIKCGTADSLYPSVTSFVYFLRAIEAPCEWQTYKDMKHDVYYFRRASVDILKRASLYFRKGK